MNEKRKITYIIIGIIVLTISIFSFYHLHKGEEAIETVPEELGELKPVPMTSKGID